MSNNFEELSISGAWLISSDTFSDARGINCFPYHSQDFSEHSGIKNTGIKQLNITFSEPNVARGIHYSLPDHEMNYLGQGKIITCVKSRIFDFIVDLRLSSKTFGQWIQIELDENANKSLFISAGLGHGFYSPEKSVVVYGCTEQYNPDKEYGISLFDSKLNLPIQGNAVVSDNDRKANTLDKAQLAGLLPQ